MAGNVTISTRRRYISFFANSEKQYSSFNHRFNQFLFDISKPSTKKFSQPLRVILPKTFAHFLDISNANTWRKIFENHAIFKAIKKGKNDNPNPYIGASPPISNIFYILQVLAPGMLVIYCEYQLPDADVKVSRLLPAASWIESNIESMGEIPVGALIAAAKDRKKAFHEERTARQQHHVIHISLSGARKNALPSSSLPRTTSALPTATTSNQKTASHKKKKQQQRSNGSNNTVPWYQKPDGDFTTGGDGYEFGMCDKDCGWCGRCSLVGYYKRAPGLGKKTQGRF